jgi:hypothetical protein
MSDAEQIHFEGSEEAAASADSSTPPDRAGRGSDDLPEPMLPEVLAIEGLVEFLKANEAAFLNPKLLIERTERLAGFRRRGIEGVARLIRSRLEATVAVPIPDQCLAIEDPIVREMTIDGWLQNEFLRRVTVREEVAKPQEVPSEILEILDGTLRQAAVEVWKAASQLRRMIDQWMVWFNKLKFEGFLACSGLAYRMREATSMCILVLCDHDVNAPSFQPSYHRSILDRFPMHPWPELRQMLPRVRKDPQATSPLWWEEPRRWPDAPWRGDVPWWDDANYYFENYEKLRLLIEPHGEGQPTIQGELWMLMERLKTAPSKAFRGGGPRLTSNVHPIIASQAAIARFLGLSGNTTGLLSNLQSKGILRFGKSISEYKHEVWFNDPMQHEKARKAIELSPKQRPRQS